MTRNQKIGIGIGVGVFVIGIILAVVLRGSNTPEVQEAPPVEANVNVAPTPETPPEAVTPKPTTDSVKVSEQSEQSQVLRLARIVIERYGSFSNRNNFENIRSLEPFMTEAFTKTSFDYISNNQEDGIGGDFYGVSTSAASLELTAFQENQTAQVTVQTRRVETRAGQENKQFNQSAVMEFQNVDGHWKVSGITWQ